MGGKRGEKKKETDEKKEKGVSAKHFRMLREKKVHNTTSQTRDSHDSPSDHTRQHHYEERKNLQVAGKNRSALSG